VSTAASRSVGRGAPAFRNLITRSRSVQARRAGIGDCAAHGRGRGLQSSARSRWCLSRRALAQLSSPPSAPTVTRGQGGTVVVFPARATTTAILPLGSDVRSYPATRAAERQRRFLARPRSRRRSGMAPAPVVKCPRRRRSPTTRAAPRQVSPPNPTSLAGGGWRTLPTRRGSAGRNRIFNIAR
jgi:hypothetical protein